jgi:hypothetical protein
MFDMLSREDYRLSQFDWAVIPTASLENFRASPVCTEKSIRRRRSKRTA